MIDLRVRAAALLGLYSCLLTLGATPAGPAVAQEGEGSTFVDRVDVHIVNVEVFVTDKKGRSVPGLTVDDFEIYENGRPHEITNFYAIEEGRPVEITLKNEEGRLVATVPAMDDAAEDAEHNRRAD